MKRFLSLLVLAALAAVPDASAQTAAAGGAQGFYRFPTLRGNTIVFAAEGDLWMVGVDGGMARRLTTHPAQESDPMISPDGKTLAFTARYEGPVEVYTMPLAGGVPVRRTYEAEASTATAWTPTGDLVYTTQHFSTLPDPQLVSINLGTGERTRIPLAQGSEGSYDASGRTLFFVRPGAQDLEVHRRRRRSAEPDARLRRREPLPTVVERPRVLRQRPRRHDERVVDGREGL